MNINEAQISNLEEVSFLFLSAEEKSRMLEDFRCIGCIAAPLGKIDTEGIPECVSPIENVNIFRNDEIFPSLDTALILKNAAVKNDEMFIAPKTME